MYFEEHLLTTASESKLLWCIVFIKVMVNVSSCGKVLSNYHLFLFICSRFKIPQLSIFLPATMSGSNSFRKLETIDIIHHTM